jgi:hypothetical protein
MVILSVVLGNSNIPRVARTLELLLSGILPTSRRLFARKAKGKRKTCAEAILRQHTISSLIVTGFRRTIANCWEPINRQLALRCDGDEFAGR